MLDLDEIEREVRAWRNPTPALVVALIERLRVAESDREALMEGLGLDPSPEALAEQRAQFGTEGLVWRWRDEIATSERARLEAELERLREAGEGTVADMQRVIAAVKVLENCITEAIDVLETGSHAPGVASLILVNAQDEFAQALNPHRFEY